MQEHGGMPPLPKADPGEPGSAKVDAQPEKQPGKIRIPEKIEVIAIGLGFYAPDRKQVGDRFFVPSMEKVGSWMKCVDPALEALHLRMMKEKRQKVNSQAVKDDADE